MTHPHSDIAVVLPNRALRGLQEFFRLEAAGGILLIAAAVLAMLMANSPLSSLYDSFRELPVQVRIESEQRGASAQSPLSAYGVSFQLFVLIPMTRKETLVLSRHQRR